MNLLDLLSLLCIESDEFAHTASTCWRVCCVIIRRCCIAALETPATSQQGSSRGFVVPGAVEGLGRMGTWAAAFSASAAERMIPVSSAESAVLFHDIKSLLRKTQTQRSPESCSAKYKIEIAEPFNRAPGRRKT